MNPDLIEEEMRRALFGDFEPVQQAATAPIPIPIPEPVP